jgi:hypothetical protein
MASNAFRFTLTPDPVLSQCWSTRSLALSLFNELKRRHVFKVAIGYIVMAWLVMQVADVILNNIT